MLLKNQLWLKAKMSKNKNKLYREKSLFNIFYLLYNKFNKFLFLY